MASKGTQIYHVRLQPDLVDEVQLAIDRHDLWRSRTFFKRYSEPMNLSKFIRLALREKLRKMERSRRPRPRRS